MAQTAPLRVPEVTWSSPVTSRLLLDAGFGGVYYGWGNFERNPNPTRDLIRDPRSGGVGLGCTPREPSHAEFVVLEVAQGKSRRR